MMMNPNGISTEYQFPKALIKGVRSIYSDKLTVIFQPHLYSRTNDLADGFAVSLDLADEVILLPIYPARELPIEGITSQMLLDKITNEHKQVCAKEAAVELIKNKNIVS
ncbi:MAG: hypothetical protein EOP45_14615 [Sphingobacteriaceae bacterium]|nr:MAG: hypothetical protein EOP45_14615 [Sphingobacteriaceae bacterium]